MQRASWRHVRAASAMLSGGFCAQANQQSAGAVFLRHNIRNEFDDLTDIARLHRVRSVPTFVFFVGGAQVASAIGCHCSMTMHCFDERHADSLGMSHGCLAEAS